MRLGYLFWIIALAIGVIVGIAKYAGIEIPQITAVLMKDTTATLLVALALALLSTIL